jgi:hypothetical protein
METIADGRAMAERAKEHVDFTDDGVTRCLRKFVTMAEAASGGSASASGEGMS